MFSSILSRVHVSCKQQMLLSNLFLKIVILRDTLKNNNSKIFS